MHGSQELLSQFTSAAVVVYALQLLKKAAWFPWVTQQSRALNRVIGMLAAFLSAVGVHGAYDSQGGTLTITGLTVAGLMSGAWAWVNQYSIQQVTYDLVAPQRKADG